MRIGLISDTHMVTDVVPRMVKNAFQDVEQILHAGDLVTLHILAALEELSPVTAVCGNMDMMGVRVKLPPKVMLEIEGQRVGLIHGHHVPNPGQVLPPPTDFGAINHYLLQEFASDKVNCIVYGHTHQARDDEVDGVRIINPGSPNHGRDGRLTVAVLEIDGTGFEVRFVDLV